MNSPRNGRGSDPMEAGFKSHPTSPALKKENDNGVVDLEALLRSCSMKGLSPKVAERIRQADTRSSL